VENVMAKRETDPPSDLYGRKKNTFFEWLEKSTKDEKYIDQPE
jgi:hypothetical protein